MEILREYEQLETALVSEFTNSFDRGYSTNREVILSLGAIRSLKGADEILRKKTFEYRPTEEIIDSFSTNTPAAIGGVRLTSGRRMSPYYFTPQIQALSWILPAQNPNPTNGPGNPAWIFLTGSVSTSAAIQYQEWEKNLLQTLLSNTNTFAKIEAVECLGSMRSIQAIPYLLDHPTLGVDEATCLDFSRRIGSWSNSEMTNFPVVCALKTIGIPQAAWDEYARKESADALDRALILSLTNHVVGSGPWRPVDP